MSKYYSVSADEIFDFAVSKMHKAADNAIHPGNMFAANQAAESGRADAFAEIVALIVRRQRAADKEFEDKQAAIKEEANNEKRNDI